MSFRPPKSKNRNTSRTCISRKSCVAPQRSRAGSVDSNTTNGSNRGGSRIATEKKSEEILSSTFNSTRERSVTEMPCDLSEIEIPAVDNLQKCPKKNEEKKKVITKLSAEKADCSYAEYLQKLYVHTLQTESMKEKRNRSEACFKDLEAAALKLENELKIVSQWLRDIGVLEECATEIDSIEKIFKEVSGDVYEMQSMLVTVNQEMKMANSQVPLNVLKVTNKSRDKFLCTIQELSNIRNEIISMIKPHQKSDEDAAQNFEKLATIVPQLRSLIRECVTALPSVLDSIVKALFLQSYKTLRTSVEHDADSQV